jgi:glutamyl-tRNA reductase
VHQPVIAAFALHQRTAPLDARERLLEVVAPWRGRSDRFVLATCHRVEIYAAVGSVEPREWIARELDHATDRSLEKRLECVAGVDAIRRLFEVASGLDSAVQGEPQIRTQVRTVVAEAPERLDPVLRRLVERALHLARSLRHATGLGRVSRSVGSLAVDEVVRLLETPGRSCVLVVGAGEMGSLAVRALVRRVGRVVVANRDRGRAEALAAATGAIAIGLDEVARVLGEAEAVVSAADTRGELLTSALLGSRTADRPLVLVDIAVPRSVGADARALPGLVYRTVDDLQGAQVLTSAEVADLRAICAREAARFVRHASERAASDAIYDVRMHADAVRRRELERALRRLRHLNERDRRVVEALAARVVNSLLHAPTVALKEEPARQEHARTLFGIGREPR